MMDNKDKLIDYYGTEVEIYRKSYFLMGQLLNPSFVRREAEKRNIVDAYIYGGEYLGIQLYQAIKSVVNVISIVDKKGKLCIPMEGIPVIDMYEFKTQYKGQVVIVTPMRYYQQIYNELIEFISDDKIMFLYEFGEK